jgi:hypothetical protein
MSVNILNHLIAFTSLLIFLKKPNEKLRFFHSFSFDIFSVAKHDWEKKE